MIRISQKLLILQNTRSITKLVKKGFLTAPFPELKSFPKTIQNYKDLHKFSIENDELFWSTLARSRLEWFKEFEIIKTGDFKDENFNLKWFIGGKLNVSGKLMHLFFVDLSDLAF
jgi:hypothetical protein